MYNQGIGARTVPNLSPMCTPLNTAVAQLFCLPSAIAERIGAILPQRGTPQQQADGGF
jgi:hypothetical protein